MNQTDSRLSRGGALARFAATMLAAGVAAGTAFGSEIAFTGGPSGTSTDLALADNWAGGTLPTAAGVTGVVDVATFGASYTLSGDVSLNGLAFANNASGATLEADSTLTLGAGGLTVSGAGGFVLKAPTATSAEQTWVLGTGAFSTWNTISGSSRLSITQASFVHHFAPPCHGGDMAYASAPVKFYEPGQWAMNLSSSSKIYFMMTGNVQVAASTLFPGGGYSNTAWDPDTEWVQRDNYKGYTYGHLLFDAGDWCPRGVGMSLGAGSITQTGGRICVTNGNANTFFVGDYHAYSGTGTPGWGNYPVNFFLLNGELVSKQIYIGQYYNVVTNPALFAQSGGTVTAGALAIGGGNQSKEGTISEYLLGGGTLDVGNARTDSQRGIALFSRGGQGSQGSGVYTQTGGVASVYRVMWGTTHSQLNGTVTATNNTGYGMFDLRGGTFNLGAGGFLTTNWNISSTNAGYTINLRGGTLATASDTVNEMTWNLPESDTPFTFSSDKEWIQNAPVAGVGTLRKAGAGTLTLTDATRFRGCLDVQEGTLAVSGSAAAEIPYSGEDVFVWTGDDAAQRQGLADGDSLDGWADVGNSLTFTNRVAPESSTVLPKSPTLCLDEKAFNGHSSVYLNHSQLMLSKEDNPLNGATNFTCAFVFRMNQGNLTCTENAPYMWQYASSLLGNFDSMSFTMSHTRDGNYSSTPRFVVGVAANGNAQYFSHMDYDVNNNRSHVAVITYSNNTIAVTLDGYTDSYVKENAADAQYWPRFANMPLYLGSLRTSAFDHDNQFIYCRVAEMRFYPQRAMSDAERHKLGYALAAKYGVNDGGVARFGAVGATFADDAEATPPACDYAWDADDLNALEDGAEVREWAVSGEGEGRFAVTKGNCLSMVRNPPVLAKSVLNGHSVVRFDRVRRTGLAAASPVKGTKKWTAAVVFRASGDAVDGNGTYSASEAVGGEGIFGARAHTWANEDFGFAWHPHGTILAAWGGDSGRNKFMRNPFRLDDGLAHVAVLSCDGDGNTYRYLVDGRIVSSGAANARNQVADWLVFGFLQNDGNKEFGFFSGDIAAARLYTRALDTDECVALCDYYAKRFSFARAGTVPIGRKNLVATGLAATNVNVASGATLRLPHSATSPYTIGAGVSLGGEGAILGSVRYAAGATLDVSAGVPDIEDIQIVDATLRFTRAQDASAPWQADNVSRISGTVTVDASDWASGKTPGRIMLMTVDPDAVDATFALTGLSQASTLSFDRSSGLLAIDTLSGTFIVIR